MLGDWVRARRKAQDLTQEELATAIGVGQGYISKLELGERENPGGKVLAGLAQALKATLEEVYIAAGLSPSSEPDELTDLLARGRALGWSRALLDAIERQAQTGQMPEDQRHALLRDLRADIEDAERRAGARAPQFPAPPEPQARPRPARLGDTEPAIEARAAQGEYPYGRPAVLDERARGGISESRAPSYQAAGEVCG